MDLNMTAIWSYCEEVGFLRFVGEMAGGFTIGCVVVCVLGCALWQIPALRFGVEAMLSVFKTFSLLVIHTYRFLQWFLRSVVSLILWSWNRVLIGVNKTHEKIALKRQKKEATRVNEEKKKRRHGVLQPLIQGSSSRNFIRQ